MTNLKSTLQQASRAFAIAILLGTSFLGAAAQAAEPTQAQESAQTTPAATAAKSSTRSEVEGYAVREQQAAATQLENFQGGDTVVIVGGTTLAIIILVILILILI